jgi:hypothetical protein
VSTGCGTGAVLVLVLIVVVFARAEELFFGRVEEEYFVLRIPDRMVRILYGVVQDGGGVVWVPGKGPHPVPPRGPVREAFIAAAIGELAKRLARTEERAAIEGAAKQLTDKAKQG